MAGPGQLVLDGDPLILSSFASDSERMAAIGLFVMAGAAIATADQYDTIGSNAGFLSNPEVLELRQAGLVGKPISLSSHAYDWDQTSRDPERWIGQLPDGRWVVGLFNRSNGPSPSTRTVEFGSLGLSQPAMVRDVWAHEGLESFTQWSASLPPHASSLVLVTPQEPVHFQAELGGFSGTARFDNFYEGFTGLGYVTGLDTSGSGLTMAIAASRSGSHTLRWRVANADRP